jgi:PBP1b-binding outer membrane lipoprotein LpoB
MNFYFKILLVLAILLSGCIGYPLTKEYYSQRVDETLTLDYTDHTFTAIGINDTKRSASGTFKENDTKITLIFNGLMGNALVLTKKGNDLTNAQGTIWKRV